MLLSVQDADQEMVGVPVPAEAATVTDVGAVIVSVTVHFAPGADPLQKPATLAWAAVMVAVSVPAVSRPATTAKTAVRRDLCIINCLSASR